MAFEAASFCLQPVWVLVFHHFNFPGGLTGAWLYIKRSETC
jgi:hypothetical protein